MSFFVAWWLFLPAAIANMAPVFVQNVPFISNPIDGGLTFGKHRLFGGNKTWRGLIAGIAAGTLTSVLQQVLLPESEIAVWWFGALLGFGALSGDLIKSFIKRRIGIADGNSFWVVDQVDWIVGALCVSLFFVQWTVTTAIMLIVSGGLAHIAVNVIGFKMRIKKNKF